MLDGDEDAAEEGSLSSDRESAEEAPAKPKKSKKKQPATKTSNKRKQLPTEQSPSAEDERSSSADLQLDELVPAKLTATTKRPKKKDLDEENTPRNHGERHQADRPHSRPSRYLRLLGRVRAESYAYDLAPGTPSTSLYLPWQGAY